MADPKKPEIEAQVSWNWGMMNDEYAWQANWYWYSENIDTRSNSRECKLSNYKDMTYLYTEYLPIAVAGDSNYEIYLSSPWWINTFSAGSSAAYKYKGYYSLNAGYFWDQMLLLWSTVINKFPYDITANWYWLRWPETSGTLSWFTGWAWWAYVSSKWTHTTGNTWTLEDTAAVISGKYYRISISHTWTYYNCLVTMWWESVWTLISSNTATSNLPFVWFVTTSSTAKLLITPQAWYNGDITDVSIVEVDAISTTSGVTENHRTFTNTTTKRPFLNFQGILYIGDGNVISKLEYSAWTYAPVSWALPTAITLLAWETVLNIFELWDQVVIFTDKSQYFWDWWNEQYDRRVPRDETIVWVAQYKTLFYVLTQWPYHTSLWKTSQWYDRVLVQKEINLSSPRRRPDTEVFTNNMFIKDGILYFNWEENIKWLNTYWASQPWMPESFSKIRWWYDWISTFIWWAYQSVVYWWSKWTDYWIARISLDTNVKYDIDAPWLVIDKPIIGKLESTNKNMMKLRMWYKFWDIHNSGIILLAKHDDEEDVFTFYSASTTVTPLVWATYTNNWQTFTVQESFKLTPTKTWIYCKRTTGTWLPNRTGTLTKTAGTWDATIGFTYNLKYRAIYSIDWYLKQSTKLTRLSIPYSASFNKIQFGRLFYTWDSTTTPIIYDFLPVYNEIQNDL